jgi:hypothetical protein
MSLSITSSTITITSLLNVGGATQITATQGAPSLLTTSGGTGTVTYSLVSGALPPGIYLSSNGQFGGIPQGRGSALVTVRATDSSTPQLFSDASVTVTVV